MRVLFIPSWFPSKGNPYAGNFIKRLAIDLSSHGIQIVILHFDYSYKQLSIKKKATETINENLTIHHFSGFQIPKINNITQNNWIQSCISESESLLKNWNFDYIHSHDYVASFLGDELAKKKNIKHIISLHHSNFIENKIQTWRVELLKNVFKNAYKVITPSTKFTQKINLDFKINAHTIPHYIYWDLKIKKAFNKELKANLTFLEE
jgi:7-cyano-7-deazaguanine synthase in queuosine biosynthesis